MKYTLEICAGDIESAIAARDGGADRIELCSALGEGGITPSAGMAAEAAMLGIKVHALIRPRGGDFLYSEAEIRTMVADINMFKQLGIDGVVIGCLTSDGNIDLNTCRRLIDAAQGLSVTFHRAFDRCCNPKLALEQIISLGCNRLLTSGQASTAFIGKNVIRELVKQANGRITIMPGCGVNANNAAEILSYTAATEIHASASTDIKSKMAFHRSEVYMGNSKTDENMHRGTSVDNVRAIISSLSSL